MDPDFEAYLSVDGVSVGERDAALLSAVAREGSLNAAADALDRSYSRAHARISELEAALGPLVERRRGGAGGGGSRLTDDAERLLARFDRLTAALDGTATTETLDVPGEVVSTDGDLATVATPAGTVRALLSESADRVRVAVRADAVTLHAPGGAPDAAETSARNEFDGTVVAVERGAATATVSVDVGTERPLAVRITEESLETLDLTVGTPVRARFKATATRATPAVRSKP